MILISGFDCTEHPRQDTEPLLSLRRVTEVTPQPLDHKAQGSRRIALGTVVLSHKSSLHEVAKIVNLW